SVSEITIETRWGVPRYSDAKETETYLLDGEMLTPVVHRGSLQDRSAEKVFHTRVEGEFRKIIRHGDQPNNYWWEVTSKDGTRHFYGGVPEGGGPDPDATLADPLRGNIFRWMLREVRDTWGNTIRYSYDLISDYGVAYGLVQGWQIYPQEIRYTGFEGTPGPYSIRFFRDRDLPGYPTNRRPDVIINARSGFKMVTADLLKQIEVRFEDEMIRRYDLEYQEGAFRKTLLKSVTQFGANGAFFHKHEFEYYDEIRNSAVDYSGFDIAESWAIPSDTVFGIMPPGGGASALGGNPSIEAGGHLYVGFNPLKPSKSFSILGGKVGYTGSIGDGILTLIDIDGDSLPDKVFKEGFGFSFRRNLSGPDENKAFGSKKSIPTLPLMLKERSDSITFGEENYLEVVSFMADLILTLTQRSTYFKDINGDGFPDLIFEDMVLFNHPEGNDNIPTFTFDSNDTPVPIGSGVVDADNLLKDFTDLFEKRVDACPLLDPVRRWVAPYSGVIQISGSVRLLEDPSQLNPPYLDADGVRVAIQHNDSELWYAEIAAGDLAWYSADVGPFQVSRNDEIFFRVQSVFDGAYDQVAWDPQIEYIDGNPFGPDANLRDPYLYAAPEDFTLAGRGARTQMPYNGTIRLSGDLTKLGVTSDDIALQILQNGTPVIEIIMAWNETGPIPLMDAIEVFKGDELEFNVRADSPIDATLMEWTPEIVYVATDADVGLTDPYGNPTLLFNPPYDVDLYPEHDLIVPQEPWVAPATGEVEVIPQLMLPPPVPFGDPFASKRAITSTKGKTLLPDSSGDRLDSKRASKSTKDKGLLPDLFDSELVLTVKRPGELVAKRVILIREGVLVPPLNFSMDVVEGEEYYFDYSTRDGRTHTDNGLADKLLIRAVYVHYTDLPIGGSVPSDFHRSVLVAEVFPEPYRGWSVIAYNGNRDRANHPIDRGSLEITDTYRIHNATVYLMVPDPTLGQWRTPGDGSGMNPDTRGCWVDSNVMSASRLGMVNISVPRPGDFAGARAMPIMSTMEQLVVGGSLGKGLELSGSMSLLAKGQCILDFLDMNGDLFPDIVGPLIIQYTTMTGGLEKWGRFSGSPLFVRQSNNNAWNFGVGFGVKANPAKSSQSAKGDVSPSSGRHSTAGASKAGEAGKSKGSSSAGRRSSGGKQGSPGKQGSE
ncbi:MAG: hypothetical protein KAJ01_01415, partial [Candidatus Hydrogenedentes bacterium]|nr:hypothetical protein [Candidatus Hydrogenedentota bacterium]